MTWLLAQAESLSGGAGWVGAGMLGVVLSWLMFKYLPDKDRQLESLVASRDRVLSEQLDFERQASDRRLQQLLQEVHQVRAQFWELIRQVAGMPKETS